MDKNTFMNSGLIEQYVMGLTSPVESAEVERMAAEYPEVKKKICDMQNCMEHYVHLQSIPPPREAKNRILATIERIAQAESQPSIAPPSGRFLQMSPWVAGMAAAVVVALLGISLFLYQNQNLAEERLAALSGELKGLKADYNQLIQSNGQVMQQYAVLKDLSTQHVSMEGTEHAPGAKLMVYWNPDHNKAYLNVVNLPRAPEGHQFQLWADVGGEHLNMGLLEEQAENKGLHLLPFINGCRGFVVTLEQEGGSKHPSVDKMYAQGKISL